ncbi:hypothetical protein LCGC14_3143770 [marine sediment metagenome]|uniref:DUF433 domain-containing protein n=1 Tax=marine sediment metagenome TaxID=412755 RepID=A0A0F8VW83_9ZZZZ
MTGRRASVSPWVGTGIYTIPEAAHLMGTNVTRVRRWLLGYRFPTKAPGGGHSPPIFLPQLPQIDHHWAIGFLDLIELLFIKAFREQGVTLPTIRKAAKEAARRWNTTHPFCVKRFATDGRSIFATLQDETGEDTLLELTRSQLCFRQFLNPYLKKLDYRGIGDVSRWWPLGKSAPVFLDPNISFGKPVIAQHNVPTEAICRALEADQTEREVADWFEIPIEAVRAAARFEECMAA